ncbi:site-2 protease family protein [Azoarcus sp. PA01]|nr:site-2 protease family protein [Azoarcus sp. PA01]
MVKGLRIGSILGVEVALDWSLMIIFVLIMLSLGAGLFPTWHPHWSAALVWLVAAVAAVLLIVSILVHELSHALVGRAQGVEIRRITLFVFGGMAQLEREPHTWRAEFWMALVGPVVSLAIGAACLVVGSALAGDVVIDPNDPTPALTQIGPLATVLLWLGPINLILALFNLVPAFPLDGGRMLRAVLWGVTGDVYHATRWAAALGRGFGIALIAAGAAMFVGIPVPLFGAGVIGGLWLALIGGFLHNAAKMSYQQLLARRSLERVPVSRVMLADVTTVEPHTSVATLIDDYLIAHDQRNFPVVRDGQLVGLAGLGEVRKLAPAARAGTTVADIMIPIGDLPTIEPDRAAAEALETISRRGVELLPVVDNGRVRGLVRREDIMKWLALRGDEEVIV